MPLLHLDHIQLAMPEGGEAAARGFYEGLLGLTEVEKPGNLKKRGGSWFEKGPIKVHLGIEKDFRPARKAHPAFLVSDLKSLVARLEQAASRPGAMSPCPAMTASMWMIPSATGSS
jgi:catechol 2,3-dioxygenase-like lactoylglutathione lyase family enzyme